MNQNDNDTSGSRTVRESHSIFIGDKIERALELIGEESDALDEWSLLSAYADDELEPEVELHENYLNVTVETRVDDAE